MLDMPFPARGEVVIKSNSLNVLAPEQTIREVAADESSAPDNKELAMNQSLTASTSGSKSARRHTRYQRHTIYLTSGRVTRSFTTGPTQILNPAAAASL